MTTPVTIDGCRVTPGAIVEPLDCERPMFGLESVADIQPISDPHMESGVEWLPYSCEAADIFCNSCSIPGDRKVFHRPDGVKLAPPFAVYGSFECAPVGFSMEQARERARRNLEFGEWRSIEKQFWTDLSTDADVVDLTPASGAVSIVLGLAVLEDYAGQNIGCMPTLHGPRGLVPTMSNASLFPTSLGDKVMRTYVGSQFAAGGGYTDIGPGGVPAAAGSAWMYVTGPVRIWQGTVFDVPEGSAPASMIDRGKNDLLALAERVVLVGRECGAAAIQVKAGIAKPDC